MQRALLIIAAFFTVTAAQAQTKTVFSIGPKLGYTFGEQGGITVGFEASFFPSVKDPINDPFRYGATFDATFWKQHVSLRLGAQIMGFAVVGLDVGPTLVWKDGESSLYLGTIFFAGAVFYPYIETIHRPGMDNLNSVGTYFKLPVAAWAGEDGWWTPRF